MAISVAAPLLGLVVCAAALAVVAMARKRRKAVYGGGSGGHLAPVAERLTGQGIHSRAARMQFQLQSLSSHAPE